MAVESTLRAFGTAQVIVTLNDASRRTAAARATAPELAEVTALFKKSESSRSSSLAFAHAPRSRALPRPYRVYRNLGVVLGDVDIAAFRALNEHRAVREVQEAPGLRLIRPVESAPAAPPEGLTWGITRLRVAELWDRGLTGSGVVVGHLDTGVSVDHPALGGAIGAFAEFGEDGARRPNAAPSDSGTHGTHTAATIVGRPVGGSRVGVAPGARLASASVIEKGNVIARILGGLDWILTQGVKVLNMSLGVEGFSEEFLQIMRTIRSSGILPVIASGNEGPGTSRSPGNYDFVPSVGASDEADGVWRFSSSQKLVRPRDPIVPDLVAPGDKVISARGADGYAVSSGSSMAAPHVAGLAALLWQSRPDASVDEVENAILGSSTLPPSMPERRANRGVPDAVVALGILAGGGLGLSIVGPMRAKRKVKQARRKGKERSRNLTPVRRAKLRSRKRRGS
jgi:subtilisin